jgi:hypothetical protein
MSLAVISMLWDGIPPDGETKYSAFHVNALHKQVSRHLSLPFEFLCLTDNLDQDFHQDVIPVKLPTEVSVLPRCYPKLWLFSDEMNSLVGAKFLYIDLDTVILRSIDSLVSDSEFCAWQHRYGQYNLTMFQHIPGTRKQLWDTFDLATSPEAASKYVGSDQAWASYVLPLDEATWGERHGMYSYKLHCRRFLPANARVVHFHGKPKPWNTNPQWAKAPYES